MSAPPVNLYPVAVTLIPTGGVPVIVIYGPNGGGLIANPATTVDQGVPPQDGPQNLYVSLTGPATLAASGTTQVIPPGGTLAIPPTANDVWVNGPVTGQRFSAYAIYSPSNNSFVPNAGSFPPKKPQALATAIPSYLYQEFSDDDDLQAFVAAYNTLAQIYVDWFNTIDLPIYTGLSGLLLDWIAAGLYGFQRPTLYSDVIYSEGPLDSYVINAINSTEGVPINAFRIINNVKNVAVTNDDIFKRIITWHFYKGDGKQITAHWIKRRVARFLYGANGTDYRDVTQNISVIVDKGQITITVVSVLTKQKLGSLNSYVINALGVPINGAALTTVAGFDVPPVATILQEALATGACETPAQFTTTMRIGALGII